MKIDKDGAVAIAEAMKPHLDTALDSRQKALDASLDEKIAKALKPVVDSVKTLEDRGRERPGLTPEGQKIVRGIQVQPLYRNGRYSGHFDIPNMTEKDIEDFRFAHIFGYLKNGQWARGAEGTKAVFEEVARQKAALNLSDDSGVGFYIPNQVMDRIIDPLRPMTVKTQLGMQMMTGLTASPIEFPRQVGVETAYWVDGDGDSEITASQQTADRIKLDPHMVAVLTPAALSLLQKAPGVVENRIRRSIVRTLELKQDAAITGGTGNGQPLGLENVTGALTVNLAGHAASTIFPLLQKCLAQLESNNVEITGGKFYMHSLAWHTLWNNQLTQAAAGNMEKFLAIEPGANGVPQKTLFGYPVVIGNSITASTTTKIFFCNWPEVLWASWFNPGIAFSDSADDAFKKVKGYFRIVEEVDIAVEHPQAVCIASPLTYLTFS